MERLILKRLSKRTLIAVLLCSVAFVAVGAYAIMLNNQPTKPSAELKRMDVSNGFVLEVDKTVYELGESVTITFTNNSTETVTFGYGGGASTLGGWATIRNSEGFPVAPGLRTTATLPVPAGESLTWVWDQLDAGGSIVPPGIYTVELYTPTIPEIPELEDLSVSFEIVG